MTAEIGILNLGMGNLRSVENAIYSLGHDPRLIAAPAELDDLSHLIIPGVGAFAAAMNRMADAGLTDAVRAFGASGRPVLGLCLGMQLLATQGDEGGETPGLGLVPGTVKRLDPALVPLIPHVGWNSVEVARPHPIFKGVKTGVDFYFVHSYIVATDHPDAVLGTTDCGERFASVIGRANAVGIQYHPEKSQANGLQMLDNFCRWNGAC